MIEFIITLTITILFVAVMSVGLLMHKPLKGSCGGINCRCKNESE
tara:strand:- start:79 stop:213 length:135 start_codon:yes stop_codon:yes gene_type:complete